MPRVYGSIPAVPLKPLFSYLLQLKVLSCRIVQIKDFRFPLAFFHLFLTAFLFVVFLFFGSKLPFPHFSEIIC